MALKNFQPHFSLSPPPGWTTLKWDVKHCIDISPLSTFYPLVVDEESEFCEEFDFRILHYLGKEKEKNVMFVMSMHHKVISYNVDDMTVKELAEVEPEELSYP
ncbi:hypothetical protein ACH5RR_003407 [Cinchona calisaya]|uniref:Uncharacterized protein n=1 Tax=Cinchona calisaya TaxID=153742 RepID=A0ABD3AUS4_9GENT